MDNLLEIEDLYVSYTVPLGHLRYGFRKLQVLKGVSLAVPKGTTVGIVGGSGSGKSTVLRSILGFVKPESGRILFKGLDLLRLRGRERKRVAREIGYVPQEPSQSINPKMKIVDVLIEPLKALGLERGEAEKRVNTVLEMLDLDRSVKNMHARELSGGMLQRIAIARALITKPKLVLLDEPTSNVDISLQAQILNILKDLKEDLGLTYLLVSHDIDVVSYIADRLAVIVSGRIVEEGPVDDMLSEPLHPYTKVLLNPETLENAVTSNNYQCPIYPWCPWKTDRCKDLQPPRVDMGSRYVCCWRYSSA